MRAEACLPISQARHVDSRELLFGASFLRLSAWINLGAVAGPCISGPHPSRRAVAIPKREIAELRLLNTQNARIESVTTTITHSNPSRLAEG